MDMGGELDFACSIGWRRDFIKYYLVFLLLAQLLPIVLGLLSPKLAKYVPHMASVVLVLQIVSAIVIFQYVHDLKEKKCACSAGIPRDVLEIYNYIMIILLVIALIGIVTHMTIMGHSMTKSIKSSK